MNNRLIDTLTRMVENAAWFVAASEDEARLMKRRMDASAFHTKDSHRFAIVPFEGKFLIAPEVSAALMNGVIRTLEEARPAQ